MAQERSEMPCVARSRLVETAIALAGEESW